MIEALLPLFCIAFARARRGAKPIAEVSASTFEDCMNTCTHTPVIIDTDISVLGGGLAAVAATLTCFRKQV